MKPGGVRISSGIGGSDDVVPSIHIISDRRDMLFPCFASSCFQKKDRKPLDATADFSACSPIEENRQIVKEVKKCIEHSYLQISPITQRLYSLPCDFVSLDRFPMQ